jgi:hypothetical protein
LPPALRESFRTPLPRPFSSPSSDRTCGYAPTRSRVRSSAVGRRSQGSTTARSGSSSFADAGSFGAPRPGGSGPGSARSTQFFALTPRLSGFLSTGTSVGCLLSFPGLSHSDPVSKNGFEIVDLRRIHPFQYPLGTLLVAGKPIGVVSSGITLMSWPVPAVFQHESCIPVTPG